MRLDVGLLEAVTMLLPLDVHVFHLRALQALLLPVEFKIDVPSDRGDWEVLFSQFHNFLLDVFIFDTLKLRVEREILGDLLVCKFGQGFNLIGWESLTTGLLGTSNRLCDVAIIKCLLLLLFFSFLFGGLT